MSDLQENVSSLRMLKPGMKVPFEHFKKPYDQSYIIPVTEGDGESPRKNRFWDLVEGKKNTITMKKIRFEAIPEEA